MLYKIKSLYRWCQGIDDWPPEIYNHAGQLISDEYIQLSSKSLSYIDRADYIMTQIFEHDVELIKDFNRIITIENDILHKYFSPYQKSKKDQYISTLSLFLEDLYPLMRGEGSKYEVQSLHNWKIRLISYILLYNQTLTPEDLLSWFEGFCLDEGDEVGSRCHADLVKYYEILLEKANELNTEKEVTSNIKNTKNEKVMKQSMMSTMLQKMKSQYLPVKVEGLKVAMDGNLCVPTSTGEMIAITAENTLVSYPEGMTFDAPFYMISKPYDQVAVGDIVKHTAQSYSKVLEKTASGRLKLLSFTGHTAYKAQIKDFIIGQSLVQVVVNLFGGMMTGTAGTGINPMMLMMMSKEGSNKDSGMRDLMMMQMASSGNMGSLNPMMLMIMNDGGLDEGSDIFEIMLMSQIAGNGNIFGGMFETSVPQPQPVAIKEDVDKPKSPRKSRAKKSTVPTNDSEEAMLEVEHEA